MVPESDNNFDVIVIGAGINGTGIARDAAVCGLRVLLLDKGDVSSGTTAWSTRLIHGGLRYLEHGEFGLVRESLKEREILLRIAPHLVKRLKLMFPIYRGHRRGRLTLKAGMLAYDLLSSGKSLPGHRMLAADAVTEFAPGIARDGLVGAALYSDAQVEYAERLAVENTISAAGHGAAVKTYCRVDRFVIDDEKLRGVEFTDTLAGDSHCARAPFIINVTGPWLDNVLGELNPKPERMLSGTKGSHIVVSRFDGAPLCALYSEARSDGRPFFIVPWNGLLLIGTTDLRYDGDLDCIEATDAEIRYLLNETNRAIPRAELTTESVLYTYSGVRPLPYAPSSAEAAITRRHIIRDHGRDDPKLDGLISIAGGKLTTFRNLAEQVVDLALKKLGRPAMPSRTASLSLPGGLPGDLEKFGNQFKAEYKLPDPVADHILRVYGSRALEVMEIAEHDPRLQEAFSEDTGAIGAEILMAFNKEHARTLSDVMLRRTMAGLGPTVGIGADNVAAQICRDYLGWDESRAQEEIRNYRTYIQRYRPRNMRRSNSFD
ncbi:MAG TPA: glycerol-3-phosphate dehydrogenase [Blastocatellia bacterium]